MNGAVFLVSANVNENEMILKSIENPKTVGTACIRLGQKLMKVFNDRSHMILKFRIGKTKNFRKQPVF